MSVEQIKKILRQAKSMGLEKIGLTGGEPFLNRRKLKALANFAVNEMKIPIHIHSNGTEISKQDAKWIKSIDAEITIPLYGNTASIHNSITKKKRSFSRTCLGLNHLIEAKANVCVYVVPMKQNLQSIEPLIRSIYAKGVRRVRILALSPTGRAKTQFAKIELNETEKRHLNWELIKIRKELIDLDLRVGFCTSQNFKGLKIMDEHEQCSAAENRVHIDTFGNVFPCTASSGGVLFSAGNLQMEENSLSSIWRDSPLFQFFRAFHRNPPKKCSMCTKHSTCMSGCRIKMSYKYGNITMADPTCKGPYD
jgi:radical SAM protein with 4Fe4S-binding SPASM domain